MNKGLIIGGIAVLAIGGAAGYYFYKKNKSEQSEATTVTTETKSISFSTANPSSLLDETADEKEAETTTETTETADEGVNGILGIGAFSTSRGKMLSTKYSDERTGLIL